VEECEHFVPALNAKPVEVYDPKVKTVAYDEASRSLEIAFKNGQSWQLSGVPSDIYQALLNQTLSSFLKLVAHRYNPRPVKTVKVTRFCPACKQGMTITHQTTGDPVRILWHCERCNQSLWFTDSKDSVRERKPGRY
jgi:hypothetical protein